jgi:predicted transglutaminase-like cysteine proteinase
MTQSDVIAARQQNDATGQHRKPVARAIYGSRTETVLPHRYRTPAPGAKDKPLAFYGIIPGRKPNSLKEPSLREALRVAMLTLFFCICAVVELRAQSDDGEPFGLVKIVAPEGPTKREWRKIMTNVKTEVRDLERCRAQPGQCKRAEQEFEAIIKEAKDQQGRARIAFVNERINGKIRYKSDKVESGVEDTWNLALAALSKNVGDCEDYALAKYAALHQAGTPDADLRIVLVRDNAVRQDHAVLAVRHDKQWLILDNRWNTLYRDQELKQFKPLFVVEKNGVSLLSKMFRLSDFNIIAPRPR